MLWIVISILTIICLLLLSAFFSSAEMAFISINRAVVKEKSRDGEKHAIILDRLLQKPENVISAIVIGNNLVNILASIIAGTVATIFFGNIGIGIATIVMMFVVIIFSESTPKSFGIRNMHFALRVARPLAFVSKLFHPLLQCIDKKFSEFCDHPLHNHPFIILPEKRICIRHQIPFDCGCMVRINSDKRCIMIELHEPCRIYPYMTF